MSEKRQISVLNDCARNFTVGCKKHKIEVTLAEEESVNVYPKYLIYECETKDIERVLFEVKASYEHHLKLKK
jgi:hypothetical protein